MSDLIRDDPPRLSAANVPLRHRVRRPCGQGVRPLDRQDAVSDTLSLPEVAERLGVSRWTIRRQVNRTGEVVAGVPVVKIGSRDRVSRIRLEEWLNQGGPAHQG